ncbi:MAG TPA: Ig-like domain-containing protein, partial [Myxococcaceae bacterium]|nr:Ig-like domain-containing protein [Myxococcaceae bacterium]
MVTALVGAASCSDGVSGGGGDGGPDGGCGFLVSCTDGGGGQPDAGNDAGVDAGVPDAGPPRPSVRAIDPPDGWTFVGRDTAVKVDVFLPNVGQGVDETTLTGDNVRLLRASDMMPIAATVNTTGGGDAIVLQPRGVLDARTGYVFQLSDRVKDQGGNAFIPFTSTFSTGDFTNLKRDPRYRYAVVDPPLWNGTPISSLAFGPDGRLYGVGLDGIIRRWPLAG